MSKKTLYFDSFCGLYISAVTENGKVNEFSIEKHSKDCAVGNVYKGVVESVHPGMQAAFIDCGLERNCFLPLNEEDKFPDSQKYDLGDENQAAPTVKAGDEILVQVVKLPVGKKGAKVTTRPAYIGKTIIYLPDYPFIGVSRKITDDELRLNLAYSAKRLKEDNEGVVVRTAAPYAKRNQIKDEYSYLKNLHRGILQAFATAKKGDVLYEDAALPVRIIRDTLDHDIDCIVAGTKELKERLEGIVSLYPYRTRRPVYLHDTGRDMLAELGIAEQILGITKPRVNLDNGGYLIIERTEALTVIDVNTGSFTGDYNLEQTVYHTNILAAQEIARQIRLRNIGGLFVVDFIDMLEKAHNKAVVDELKRALKSDKAKCSVGGMSEFGLVEFTRKRIGSSPLPLMTKPCGRCLGAGAELTAELVLLNMRAKLLDMITDGAKRIRLDMSADVLACLTGWQNLLTELKNRNADIYAVPHKSYGTEEIRYKCGEFDIPDNAVKL